MPAKKYTDIPSDAKIQIRTISNRIPKEVQIEAVDSNGDLIHGKGDRQLLGIKAEIFVEPTSKKEVWRVTNSLAEKGYGPLAYDLMMELASSGENIGMITGTGLTAESTNIWRHYVEHRNDVTKAAITESSVLGPLHSKVDVKFPFIWRKTATILPLLEAAGKIQRIEGEDDILASIEQYPMEEDEQLQRLFDADEEEQRRISAQFKNATDAQ